VTNPAGATVDEFAASLWTTEPRLATLRVFSEDGPQDRPTKNLGIWMAAMTIFYAWVSYMLLIDKDVGSHFNPTSGF
jgi:hypothetical protein